MNLQHTVWAKTVMLSLSFLCLSFLVISCNEDPITPQDEGLVMEQDLTAPNLNANTLPADYIIRESDEGQLIYDFSPKTGANEKSGPECEFLICLEVLDKAVVFIEFPNSPPSPLQFCGPFDDCIVLTGLSGSLPITATISYMGVGGAKDVIYGYPAGGPISLPPDVVLKFPPTTEVVCEQRMVQLRKNCTAIEVADM